MVTVPAQTPLSERGIEEKYASKYRALVMDGFDSNISAFKPSLASVAGSVTA